MAILRTDIEGALDDLAYQEEGLRVQGARAVVMELITVAAEASVFGTDSYVVFLNRQRD